LKKGESKLIDWIPSGDLDQKIKIQNWFFHPE
jgi:hypothetical protein